MIFFCHVQILLVKHTDLYFMRLTVTYSALCSLVTEYLFLSVKFVLVPSGQVVTLACTLGQTLELLKSHFASELKMPASAIMLMFNGEYTSCRNFLKKSF